ncbi:helix-turn-helix domain-containing protein [Listeria newyorkensis]|uniref:Helix-turn-helix domain-containing protein n=1 Tax=Listeria newyorkensis TaxID=1497681 RepID=A0A841YXZ7_9LIST|nr:helix-turn-helix domain-containing protein [Listeria newyorkensis]MBC1458414.1 helix-turn-helix domain-containing protein [Listeria newyorkensis]
MDKKKAIVLLENYFFTTEEAATFLGISKQALSSLVKRGKLERVEKGQTCLFFKADLEKRKQEQVTLRKKYRPYT